MRTLAFVVASLVTPFAWSQEAVAKGWVAEVAFTAPAKLGGCVVADVDPRHKGSEIVAVSTAGEVFAVRRAGGKWESEAMARASGEMIRCAAGELDAAAPGEEVVAVGMASGGEKDGGPGAAHVLRWTGKAWASEEILRDSDHDPRRVHRGPRPDPSRQRDPRRRLQQQGDDGLPRRRPLGFRARGRSRSARQERHGLRRGRGRRLHLRGVSST